MQPEAKDKELIIGIDLGTTNSLAAVFEGNQPVILRDDDSDDGVIPSIMTLTEDRVVVGKEARELFARYPTQTVYSAKRFIGKTYQDLPEQFRTFPFSVYGDHQSLRLGVGEREMSAVEVSAEILRALKQKAEQVLKQPVKKAVITVPAYFDDTQRTETRLAAQAAGLQVERIINEPTAAALAYGIDKKQDGLIAVYDLGGGTFDISVLHLEDGVFKVLSTNGDTFLGGDDFDKVIGDWILESMQADSKQWEKPDSEIQMALKVASEQVKIRLSLSDSVPVKIALPHRGFEFEGTLTRDDFNQRIKPLVKRTIRSCKQALKDASLSKEEITQVVLVGGSTRVPLVREMVQEFFGKTPFVGLNPDEVVALGAAVQGQILSGGNRDVLLLDVIPLSLGIETLGGAVTKILLRNSTIPVSHTEEFTTSVDNQSAITIHVLQGERELVEDCRSLGKFKVGGLPPMPAGLPRLKVTFTVDENGILKVSAKEERTGKTADIEICPSIGLTHNEMHRIIEESINSAVDDFTTRMVVELRNKLQRIVIATERVMHTARDFYSEDDLKALSDALEKGKKALETSSKDQAELTSLTEFLGNLTRPLADHIMTKATEDALKGKTAKDLQGID